MSIVLPALGIAFAAFCVWLGVRVYNRRERWAKWSLATILMSGLYPGTYLIFVDKAYGDPFDPERVKAHYPAFGYVTTAQIQSQRFFWLAHFIDRRIRREFWQTMPEWATDARQTEVPQR
jgi:hypothetical protein